ncbi:MAG: DoxX family protein [Schleiferiaceae bacterium]
MQIITSLFRIFVGVLFIFSGAIKLNDPKGFSYKLEEYFAPDVLNLPFLMDFALAISVILVIVEIILGVALLVGFKPKLTTYSLSAMIVFFTFLTFYSAYFNKVTDCGCFGDAIPLTPWESFYKDLILLVMIAWLTWKNKTISPIMSDKAQWGVVGFFTLASILFGNYVLNHLPVMDFRPYAVGNDLVKGMMSAEELGLEPPQFETFYTLENTETGERVEVTATQYVEEKVYENKALKLIPELSSSRKIAEGYEPPIHDFAMYYQGADVTKSVIWAPQYLLIFTKDIKVLSDEEVASVIALVDDATNAQLPSIVITSTSEDVVLDFYKKYHPNFNFGLMDETTVKTIVRANPGVMLIRGGIVKGKWTLDDSPSVEEMKNTLL